MAEDSSPRIEVVRHSLDGVRADQVLALWSTHGVLSGDTARERLAQVVAVAVDVDEVVGVCSVYDTAVALVGHRRFWAYRRFLAPGVSTGTEAALLAAAFDALDAEFVAAPTGPLGLCLVVDDPAVMRARPEAVWPDLQLTLAGFQADGSQLRIRYFTDARIT